MAPRNLFLVHWISRICPFAPACLVDKGVLDVPGGYPFAQLVNPQDFRLTRQIENLLFFSSLLRHV